MSEIGQGCMGLGWSWGDLVPERDCRELLIKAVDNGVNFFDTSDAYGDGRSEQLLGELIKSSHQKNYLLQLKLEEGIVVQTMLRDIKKNILKSSLIDRCSN